LGERGTGQRNNIANTVVGDRKLKSNCAGLRGREQQLKKGPRRAEDLWVNPTLNEGTTHLPSYKRGRDLDRNPEKTGKGSAKVGNHFWKVSVSPSDNVCVLSKQKW